MNSDTFERACREADRKAAAQPQDHRLKRPRRLLPSTGAASCLRAGALETVILRLRCSLAVRLTASALEGIAVHCQAPQNGISSPKSSARGFLLAAGLSCFGLTERLRYFLPFFEVRTQPLIQ